MNELYLILVKERRKNSRITSRNTLLQGLGVTDAEVAQLATLYPSDLTQGSPYGTGDTDALSPQYKRLASLQGDLIFQAPRRFLLQNRAGKQTVFAFRGSSVRVQNKY